MPLETRICDDCKQPFQPASWRARWCSDCREKNKEVHWRVNMRQQREKWTPEKRKELSQNEVKRQQKLKKEGKFKKVAWVSPLTSKETAAMLRRVAERHGYTASRGPHAGKGEPVQLAYALGTGELATILLSDEQRSMAIRWLDEQAKVIEDSSLAGAIKSIADQLYDAVYFEAKIDEQELRSHLLIDR